MDLHKHELSWWLFAAFGKDLGIPCIYNSEGQCDLLALMLCIICNVAFCCDHSHGHECIGTHRSHTNPVKYAEFQCQHCKITFKEYDGSWRYADFTHTLDWFESRKNIRKKLKKKQKILPTCLPCERRVEKELTEYVPVLPDDSDDDKATDAHNQDHQRIDLAVVDHDEGAYAAYTDNDDAAAKGDDGHSQDDMGASSGYLIDGMSADDTQSPDGIGASDANYGKKVSADEVHSQDNKGVCDAYSDEKVTADDAYKHNDEGAADASCDGYKGAAVNNICSQNDCITDNDDQNQNGERTDDSYGVSSDHNKRYIDTICIVWIVFIYVVSSSFRELHHFLTSLTNPVDVNEIDANLVFYDIMEGYNPFERFNCKLIAKGRAYTLKKTMIYLYWSKLKVDCAYCLETMRLEDFDRLKLERYGLNMYQLP